MNKLGDAARVSGDDLVVTVRVTPRAKRNEVGEVENGMLRIRTTAAPADGHRLWLFFDQSEGLWRRLAAPLSIRFFTAIIIPSPMKAPGGRIASRMPGMTPPRNMPGTDTPVTIRA